MVKEKHKHHTHQFVTFSYFIISSFKSSQFLDACNIYNAFTHA